MARRENESDETLYARERLSLFCETSSSFSINSLFRFFSTQFFLLSLVALSSFLMVFTSLEEEEEGLDAFESERWKETFLSLSLSLSLWTMGTGFL